MFKPAQQTKQIAEGVAKYIAAYLDSHGKFETRSFYGESFSLNLLSRHGLLNDKLKTILLNAYRAKHKADPEFHFEFNNYAFVDYLSQNPDKPIEAEVLPLKFKGTSCTNWTLLRSAVSLMVNPSDQNALNEARAKLAMQLKSGLILDDPGVKSFQYHCFSAAMLGEIFLRTKDSEFKTAFTKAVTFIRHFILKDGNTLYIGRGQQQSFGLGVLVYILSLSYFLDKDETLLTDLEAVLKLIEKFKNEDGSFPLVFTGTEPKTPGNVDMRSPAFCGWYPYNNYFDYLPFFAYFLDKASELLKGVELEYSDSKKLTSYFDKDFILISKFNYTAILSLPGGYWTNDLPFPLIQYKKRFQTPMLGGEQFQDSLYSLESLSMPVTKRKNLSWRKYGRGFLLGNNLIWFSLFGFMIRKFSFLESEIKIEHHTVCWIPSLQSFSLFADAFKNGNEYRTRDLALTFSKPVCEERKGYSASGELKVLLTDIKVNVRVELR